MAMQPIKAMLISPESGHRLRAGVLMVFMFSLPATGHTAHEQGGKSTDQVSAFVAKHKVSSYRPGVPDSAKVYYQAAWGVDNMLVRQMASGNLIRFSYRVTDPVRARVLGNKLATPLLYGQRSRALLHIPVMDKIGQLRQSGAADAGKEYWMVFSNKGNVVKPGDRVDVVIGAFHAEGLLVE